VSAPTGAVTITNIGVTSVAAGSGISVSGLTGGVTISASGNFTSPIIAPTFRTATCTKEINFSGAGSIIIDTAAGEFIPALSSTITGGGSINVYILGSGTPYIPYPTVFNSTGHVIFDNGQVTRAQGQMQTSLALFYNGNNIRVTVPKTSTFNGLTLTLPDSGEILCINILHYG
jgi:hypothetical protein